MPTTNSDETSNNVNIPFHKVNVKFLILKFGKLLLIKPSENKTSKWSLVEGVVNSGENLNYAITREILVKSGWETHNIRLFGINVETSEPGESDFSNIGIKREINSEVVFIVDAVNQTLNTDSKIKGLRWFPLNDLPKPEEIDPAHLEVIYELAHLLHRGKTLDLDHLPPVFSLEKPLFDNGTKDLKNEKSKKLLQFS